VTQPPVQDLRNHAALPTLGARGQGDASNVPQRAGSRRTQPTLRSGSEQTPGRQRPQVGGNQGMDLHRTGESPVPPPLPASPHPTPCLSPGASSAACLHSPARAWGDLSPQAERPSCWGPAAEDGQGCPGDCRDLVYYLNSECLFSSCKIYR